MPVATVPDLWADPLGTDPLLADPLGGFVLGTSEGGSLGGTPFLPDQLDNARLIVLAGLGADLTKDPAFWAANFVDITKDVLQDNGRTVSMKVGRQDWSSTAFPATCTFAVKNLTGDYSAYNAVSKNWPNLVPGTPIWVLLFIGGGYYTRFYGEAAGFQPRWDTTGNYAIVVVSANGVLNRLGVGAGTGQASPLHSAMYRALSQTSPLAYWSLEDGSAATQATSGLIGGSAMRVSGIVRWATVTGPAGSGALSDLSSGAELLGTIPAGTSTTSWRVEFVAKFNTFTGGAFSSIVQWATTGSIATWEVDATDKVSGGLYIQTISSGGAANLYVSNVTVDDGQWHHIRVTADRSGSDIALVVYLDNVAVITQTITGTTMGPISSIIINPTNSAAEAVPAMGHLAVWGPWSSTVDTYRVYTGWLGETPLDRLTRLCAEEGVPYTTTGRARTSAAMGAQGVDTLGNLLRECEATDAGLLYDGLAPGLQYQPIAARYNAASVLSLDASAGQLLPPFDPQDDLFGRINRAVVTRKNGGTATFEDDTGQLGVNLIGPRVGSPPQQPNYSTDTPLRSRAGHEVRKGTLTGFRYPNFALQLRKIPGKVPGWLAVTPGSAISITPPYPAQLPTDTLTEVVEGWQEDLSKLSWMVTAFCSRGDIYQIGKVSTTGRIDSAGSTLAAPAAVGATSLTVNVTGRVWGTTNLPCDFWIAGIRVTATAISGATSPQTFTVTGSTVTKQLYAGDTVRLWRRTYPGL